MLVFLSVGNGKKSPVGLGGRRKKMELKGWCVEKGVFIKGKRACV